MRTPLMAGMVLCTALGGCGDSAKLIHHEDTGPDPTLPEPKRRLIPTVDIAPAKGWSAGVMPTAAAGLGVTAYARGLQHPRWLYVLPNGDVLVAETNAPERPEDGKGIKAKVMKVMRKRAGAGVPSANRITLLRDTDRDGVADERHVFLANLVSPFGMALVGDMFYVANADAIVKFPYRRDATSITEGPSKVADLPGGPINHHWTKSLVASADGKRLYVGVGSNSNAAENGIDVEKDRAVVLEIDAATGSSRVFASGLRNPVGLAWQPFSGGLWVVVNERDELGSDLVPDYLTSVREGAFYGWPYSYYGPHVDPRVKPARADLVAKAIAPDYALGAHVAPLGLAFNTATQWPAAYQNGAFVGLHGSWNRKPPNGYKVSFVPFAEGMPKGDMSEVLGGFLDADGNARGRPVGLAIDARGGLLVADDVGDVVWRVAPL